MFGYLKLSLGLIFLNFLSLDASGQTLNKYFGYFFNDAYSSVAMTTRSFDENNGHINIYHIGQFIIGNNTVDREATTQYMLGELAKAKAKGVRAIITATPFVLYWTDSTGKWSEEPNATALWQHLVDELVDHGYIVPGNAKLSTVAAIYAIDEPNGAGFADVNGAANPTLLSAVQALRSDARVASIPLASIMSVGFDSNIPSGLRLFDWVGFDDYGISQSKWEKEYGTLKSLLNSNQRTIIVAKAAYGGDLGNSVSWDDPNWINSVFQNDPIAIWLSPFVWFSSSSRTGTRDIPALRSSYTEIGSRIKASGCQSSPAERVYCLGRARRGIVGSVITPLLLN